VRAKLRHQLYETSFLGMGIMAGPDLAKFLSASRGNPRGLLHAGWRFGLHILDLLTHRRNMQLVNGTALTGRLLQSADSFGVDIRVSTPARRLLTDDAGKVTGAVVGIPEGEVQINAAAGWSWPPAASRRTWSAEGSCSRTTPTGREHWTLAPAEASG
jgi:hypothetical protein